MKAKIFTFIILFSFTEIYAQNYWSQTSGPNGSEVTCIFRSSAGKIFCGTHDGGIYYSTNNGINWTNVQGIPNSITSIIETQNGYLFAGSDYPGAGNSGIYRSTDGGNSWVYLNFSLSVKSLLGKIPGVIYAGISPQGVYKSTNNGTNWTLSSNGIDNNGVNSLESDGNGYLYGGGFTSGKIYRSTDAGATWQTVYTSGQNDMIYKIVAPPNENKIYACIGSKGIYYSLNSGSNWSLFGFNNLNMKDLEIDSNNYYACTEYSYYYSPNGGLNWLERNLNIGGLNYLKDILPDTTGVAIAVVNGTNDGVYKLFFDSGNSLYLSSDFKNSKIQAMCAVENGAIIAFSSNGKIYKTTNNGILWELKFTGYPTSPIVTACKDSLNNIYAGTTNGYHFSSNGGNSWIFRSSIFYNKKIQSIVSPSQGVLIAATDVGIYVSTNSGTNWVNTLNTNIISLALGPTGTIYAGKSFSPFVYMSTNMGNSWYNINGSGQFYLLNSVAVTTNNLLLVGTIDGILLSPNNGVNWTRVFEGHEINGFTINHLNQIYAYSYEDGVYYSSNNGGIGTWIQLNSGLTISNIQSMAISLTGYVYAGSFGRSVFKSNYITSVNMYNKDIKNFSLSQNYPNPFNPTTKIKFDVPTSNLTLSEAKGLHVSVIIYDILGREVATLVNENLKPGTYEVSWDASNYPSGVYFYKLISNNFEESRKMILLR